MQQGSREVHGEMADSAAAQMALHELHDEHGDLFDQMLSGLPSAWADLGNPKSPWEADASSGQKLFRVDLAGKPPPDDSHFDEAIRYAAYDESTLLTSRIRERQSGGSSSPTEKVMMLQMNNHHILPAIGLPPAAARGGRGSDSCHLPLPLPLALDMDRPYKSPDHNVGEELYNGFGGSLRQAQAATGPHFHNPQTQSYGGAAPATSGGPTPPPKQRVRARRGQATDPHSIAERLRRERIAERTKALQELVPNANKTDKASMLDEIIDYVKFLQLQVKVLSMSRLGGAAAVAPLVADMSAQAPNSRAVADGAATGNNNHLTVAERRVAKLMEEDMGSAMQYLQGKGLCLMPISLASAISSAACRPSLDGLVPTLRPNAAAAAAVEPPTSPSASALTMQSATANGTADGAARDGSSKP